LIFNGKRYNCLPTLQVDMTLSMLPGDERNYEEQPYGSCYDDFFLIFFFFFRRRK